MTDWIGLGKEGIELIGEVLMHEQWLTLEWNEHCNCCALGNTRRDELVSH